MPSEQALAEVAAAAGHRFNAHLRPLTADETQLLAEAVDGGAHVRSDSAFEDFINGGALPLLWGRHTAVGCKFVTGWTAGAAEREAAFMERVNRGDLRPVALRIHAERAALAEAA